MVAAVSANRRNTLNTNANVTTEGQLRSRRKAAKMLVAVVIMFAVCYFPVHVLSILRYVEMTSSWADVDESKWSTAGNVLLMEVDCGDLSRDEVPQLVISELSLFVHLTLQSAVPAVCTTCFNIRNSQFVYQKPTLQRNPPLGRQCLH